MYRLQTDVLAEGRGHFLEIDIYGPGFHYTIITNFDLKSCEWKCYIHINGPRALILYAKT